MTRPRWAIAMAMVFVALAGCKTTQEAAQQNMPVPQMPFTPQRTMAQVQWVEGRYPDLFDATSNAIWGGQDMQAAIGEDGMMLSGPLKIDLYAASAFADMSVAYDVVGLRGIDVYLLMPDGQKVRPAQVLRGRDLEERQQGALKFFARRNQLLFGMPIDAVMVPVVSGVPAPLRLILEGHGAKYAFQWHAVPPVPGTYEVSDADKTRAYMKAAGDGVKSTIKKVDDFSHTFD
jgi:hypothetical protein